MTVRQQGGGWRVSRFGLPQRGWTRLAAGAGRVVPARFRGRTTVGTLVITLVGALTLGTGATVVTAVAVSHHSHPVATAAEGWQGGVLPPAQTDVAGPIQPPAAVNTPGLEAAQHHSRHHLVSATLLVTAPHPLSNRQMRRLDQLSGVRRVQTLSAGHARVEGHKAFVLGVDPTTFRPWTPQQTAASNPLWQSISQGDVAVSFDMGQNANLPLGGTVPVGDPAGLAAMRIGAFASVGMAGVDAVMSDARATQIGLTPNTGVLISAPKADPLQLRRDVLDIVGHKAHAELLREVVITRDAGEFLTRLQIYNFLRAAESRVGLPYVWGAAGPASFDCSGLVQWAFAYAGVRMPRVSEEQWFTGPHIPYADARPGDLLFWHYDRTDPTDIDHVAIYLGDGKMVVAPHTGEYVSIEPVPLSNMAGVVRVDPVLGAELS